MRGSEPEDWLQITLRVAKDRVEDLAARLNAAGAAALTYRDAGDEPLYEPPPGSAPLWAQTEVTALFAPGTDSARVLARVGQALPQSGAWAHRVEAVPAQGWERAWARDLAPVGVGSGLWICPSGTQPPADAEACVRLDPGLAFGTGAHPSTRLCLEWLAQAPLAGARVVDYGCGSGILALAALKLGARRAWAVDIDAQALQAARANARRNGVARRLETLEPRALPALQVDLLVANILSGPLIEHAAHLAGLVRPGGALVLCGVLTEQAAPVARAYRAWVDWGATAERSGWARLAGTRRYAGGAGAEV